MNDIELLKKAREIISKPENWIQHAFARDSEGDIVSSSSAKAVCFCSVGAVKRAYGLEDLNTKGIYYSALDKLCRRTKGVGMTIARYNDHEGTTHTEILAMFDEAIND